MPGMNDQRDISAMDPRQQHLFRNGKLCACPLCRRLILPCHDADASRFKEHRPKLYQSIPAELGGDLRYCMTCGCHPFVSSRSTRGEWKGAGFGDCDCQAGQHRLLRCRRKNWCCGLTDFLEMPPREFGAYVRGDGPPAVPELPFAEWPTLRLALVSVRGSHRAIMAFSRDGREETDDEDSTDGEFSSNATQAIGHTTDDSYTSEDDQECPMSLPRRRVSGASSS